MLFTVPPKQFVQQYLVSAGLLFIYPHPNLCTKELKKITRSALNSENLEVH